MIKINLSNIEAKENSKIINNAHLYGGDAEINVENIKAAGEASILEGLDINEIIENITEKIQYIDKASPEYSSLCRIVNVSDGDKKSLVKMLKEHILNFSQGVLQAVIIDQINKRI